MIPPSGFLRRIVLTAVIVTVPLLLVLLFTYDVIKINWTSTMEDQPSIGYQQDPRLAAPADAVSFEGPSLPKDGQQPVNPIPVDAVSLQRGQLLFDRNCALCHGDLGKGDGPIAAYFAQDARRPADLTSADVASQSDGAIYLTISEGFGTMPPLRENLSVRERWDVVNFVQSLSK